MPGPPCGDAQLAALCRACLAPAPAPAATPLAPPLCAQLEYVLGSPVRAGDGLPAGACARCCRELPLAYEFVRRARDTRDTLLKLISRGRPADEPDLKQEDDGFDSSASSAECADPTWSCKDEEHSEADDDESIKSETQNEQPVDIKIIKKRKKKNMFKSNKLACDTCGLTVQSHSAFLIHNRKHTGERPFICHYCAQAFTQKGTLATHISRKHAAVRKTLEKKHSCDTCGKCFATSTYLKIHMRTHTGEKPYKCKLCPAAYTQVGSLIIHRRRHTGEKPFKCPNCDRTFYDQTHLKRHNRVHSDERPFECKICKVRHKSRTSLKVHLSLHTDLKPFVCEACGKAFRIVSSLLSHKQQVHSEKSGWCNTCNKFMSDLAEHELKHGDEKKYICSVCEAKFSLRKGLVTHMRQHSTHRVPCSIPGCKKTFFQGKQLEVHLLKHSGVLPHPCPYCSKSLLRPCDLTRHLNYYHANEGKASAS